MQHRRLLTGIHHYLLTVTDSIGVDRSGMELPSWRHRIDALSRLMRSRTVCSVDKVRQLEFINKKQPLSSFIKNYLAADNINLHYGGKQAEDNPPLERLHCIILLFVIQGVIK